MYMSFGGFSVKNKILLTKPAFEWLIEHLVYIEESTDKLVNFYYPTVSIEQSDMKKLFTNYVNKIDAELERIEIVNSLEKFRYTGDLNEFPFVIIGSQVDIVDLSDNSSISVKLIHPVEHSKHKDEITYLSSLGRALILKEVGSEVVVNMPIGLRRFKVKSIKLL